MNSHELSADAQRLLAVERRLVRVPDAVRVRAFARARAALRAADAAPPGFFKQRSVLLAAALVIAFAAVSFAALQSRRTPPERSSTSAPPAARANPRANTAAIAAAPSSAPPVTVPPLAEPQPSPAEPAPEKKSTAAAAPRAASSVDPYALELATLQRARTALSAGDFSAALAALSEHQRRFPAGRLVEEREALRVKALLGLGQSDEARRTAERFRARFPRSVLLPRIEETTRR